jgi:hypothetical protein
MGKLATAFVAPSFEEEGDDDEDEMAVVKETLDFGFGFKRTEDSMNLLPSEAEAMATTGRAEDLALLRVPETETKDDP